MHTPPPWAATQGGVFFAQFYSSCPAPPPRLFRVTWCRRLPLAGRSVNRVSVGRRHPRVNWQPRGESACASSALHPRQYATSLRFELDCLDTGPHPAVTPLAAGGPIPSIRLSVRVSAYCFPSLPFESRSWGHETPERDRSDRWALFESYSDSTKPTVEMQGDPVAIRRATSNTVQIRFP